MANPDRIQKKREQLDELRAEIEERKIEMAVAVAEASEQAREDRLDSEIARLKAELAAMDQRQVEVEAVAAGVKPPAPPTLDEMTVDQLTQQPEYATIDGRADMNKEQLLKAVKAARESGSNVEDPDANRTSTVPTQEGK